MMRGSCGHRPVRPGAWQSTATSPLSDEAAGARNKPLILCHLRSWLAALDDFRNWLIQEAA
jgi:hypothetical protein